MVKYELMILNLFLFQYFQYIGEIKGGNFSDFLHLNKFINFIEDIKAAHREWLQRPKTVFFSFMRIGWPLIKVIDILFNFIIYFNLMKLYYMSYYISYSFRK